MDEAATVGAEKALIMIRFKDYKNYTIYEKKNWIKIKNAILTLGMEVGEAPPQSYISRNQLRWRKKSHEYQ